MKFLNSPYSIVCLITKNGFKNGRIFKFFVGKCTVDSPFSDDSKNIIFLGRAYFRGRDGRKIKEMGNNRDICSYPNRGGGWVGQFRKRILACNPRYQNPRGPQFSYMADQILGKKLKNAIFRPKFDSFYVPLPPKI